MSKTLCAIKTLFFPSFLLFFFKGSIFFHGNFHTKIVEVHRHFQIAGKKLFTKNAQLFSALSILKTSEVINLLISV